MPERRRNIDPALDYRNWGVLAGSVEGQKMIARVRMDAMDEGRGQMYSQAVTVSVAIQDPTPDGLPNMDEMNRLDQIEGRLHEVIRDVGGAILAVLISTGGRRELVMYSEDHGWATTHRDRLEAAIGEHAARVVVTEDAAWDFYRRLREHAR